jgi:hypothetical protein
MLQHNKLNRPINWRRVEEYADVMAHGKWKLHAQGIILDVDGNVLTGQKRLWAVIYSGVSVHMRVSRGNPADTAALIDRGTPQTARDLASRQSGRKHSPIEAAIARAALALAGNSRPSTDDLAAAIKAQESVVGMLLAETTKIKKTRSVVMILAALATMGPLVARQRVPMVPPMSDTLDQALGLYSADKVWGKGSAFGLAMEQARRIATGDAVAVTP